MAGKRLRRKVVNGIVLVNKAAGLTSADVVKQVSRLYNAKKAGHTGTLDPFATGLLPVCLGEATKVSSFLLASDKGYIATLQLGEATDTGDHDGEVIERAQVPAFSQETLEAILASFKGKSMQLPPMYSSLKHEGQSLHVYARQGIEIEREHREINILDIKLLDFTPTQIKFEVHCTKGTYIRVLGCDIAQALGTVGHLIALHRTHTGVFHSEMMRTIEDIARYRNTSLLSLDIALTDYEALQLTAEQKQHLWTGGFLFDIKPTDPQHNSLVTLFDEQQQLFAVGEWQADKQRLKIKRGFHLDSPASVE